MSRHESLKIPNAPGFALIGLFFVFLGVLLLLTSVGSVSFGIWLKLLDYWPVLLVLVGIEILLAEAPFLVRAGIVSLTLLATAVAAFAFTPQYESAEPLRVSFTEPAGGVETLHLDTSFFWRRHGDYFGNNGCRTVGSAGTGRFF